MRVKCGSLIHEIPVRGFCDTGSQINLITEDCVQLLKIFKIRTNTTVATVVKQIIIKNKVKFSILARDHNRIEIPIEALVVPNIPGSFPEEQIHSPPLNPLHLADPTFCTPQPVDLLLGVGVWAAIVEAQCSKLPSAP